MIRETLFGGARRGTHHAGEGHGAARATAHGEGRARQSFKGRLKSRVPMKNPMAKDGRRGCNRLSTLLITASVVTLIAVPVVLYLQTTWISNLTDIDIFIEDSKDAVLTIVPGRRMNVHLFIEQDLDCVAAFDRLSATVQPAGSPAVDLWMACDTFVTNWEQSFSPPLQQLAYLTFDLRQHNGTQEVSLMSGARFWATRRNFEVKEASRSGIRRISWPIVIALSIFLLLAGGLSFVWGVGLIYQRRNQGHFHDHFHLNTSPRARAGTALIQRAGTAVLHRTNTVGVQKSHTSNSGGPRGGAAGTVANAREGKPAAAAAAAAHVRIAREVDEGRPAAAGAHVRIAEFDEAPPSRTPSPQRAQNTAAKRAERQAKSTTPNAEATSTMPRAQAKAAAPILRNRLAA